MMKIRTGYQLLAAASFLSLLVSCAALRPASVTSEAAFPEQFLTLPSADAGADIEPPKAIRRVGPVAPADFAITHQRATATVEAVIGADGRVEASRYSSGDRQWAKAVAAALRQWQFEPAKRNGQPTAVRFLFTATFTRG